MYPKLTQPFTFQFRELMSHIQVSLVELCLVIDILRTVSKWLPRFLVKRLVEIQERVLEADIWDDAVFVRFIDQRARGAVPAYETLTAKVHAIVARVDTHHGPEVLYRSFMNVARARMDSYTAPLSCDLSSQARSLFEYVVTNESKVRVLSNRNLDVVLMCCIYTSLQIARSDMFDRVLEIYKSAPTYTEMNLMSVEMGQGVKAPLLEFWRSGFVKAVAGYIEKRGLSLPSESLRYTAAAPASPMGKPRQMGQLKRSTTRSLFTVPPRA
jgi:Retinoblastoma-associated protein B domain